MEIVGFVLTKAKIAVMVENWIWDKEFSETDSKGVDINVSQFN